MSWRLARRLAFGLDAERAHDLAIRALALAGSLQGDQSELEPPTESARLNRRVFGVEFVHPLGLAAGFDKNARALLGLPGSGFSYVEIGTVTPRPQAGNPRPRLFRDPASASLFNRLGFNNDGADRIAARVIAARPRLPRWFRIGVNVGKNRDTLERDAPSDYARALAPFVGCVDYAVVNVSSPNTPGLRGLQELAPLGAIVEATIAEARRSPQPLPVLVKLAPEFGAQVESDWVLTLEGLGVAGWVVSNTVGGEWREQPGATAITGGWSGRRIREASSLALVRLRSLSRLPIIGVGGIGDAASARERLRLGADLIQIYSGWVFGGPSLPHQIKRALSLESLEPETAQKT